MVVEKVEELKKKVEHPALPKALNDFTRHKEVEERNKQNENTNGDGDWGKMAENEQEEEEDTSEQIFKNESPPTQSSNEENVLQPSAVITEETFQPLSNGIDDESNKNLAKVTR